MPSSQSRYVSSGLPFFAYIGPKACHDPFEAAPWYRDTWNATWPATAPRTVNWNVSHAALALHHPTVSARQPLSEQTATCIDQNFRDRWRTLLSVDDLIGSVIDAVSETGVLPHTFIVYTSDHGCEWSRSRTQPVQHRARSEVGLMSSALHRCAAPLRGGYTTVGYCSVGYTAPEAELAILTILDLLTILTTPHPRLSGAVP